MNIYFLIFHNSLKAHFLVSLTSENAWFAARDFGGYDMSLATTAAFAGSMLGMCINYGLGFYLSRWRQDMPVFSEEIYAKVSLFFKEKLFLLLAVPPLFILDLMPGFSLFALVCGMFRVPPRRAIAAIACSRMLYYMYHLSNS